MSLGICKKMAALLSVICISVALNGCGPAAETPTAGGGAAANSDSTPEDGGNAAAEGEGEGESEGEGSTAF